MILAIKNGPRSKPAGRPQKSNGPCVARSCSSRDMRRNTYSILHLAALYSLLDAVSEHCIERNAVGVVCIPNSAFYVNIIGSSVTGFADAARSAMLARCCSFCGAEAWPRGDNMKVVSGVLELLQVTTTKHLMQIMYV